MGPNPYQSPQVDLDPLRVYSAYQGFVIVRPRVVKYLQAASRLDALLHTLE